MISLSHITIGGVQTFNDLAWFINYALRIVATICGVHNDKDFLKTYSFQESVSQCNYLTIVGALKIFRASHAIKI